MSTDVPAPIEIRGLSKQYRVGFTRSRTVRALQALDLRIEKGQVYGLLGPNGAGKSTTIKILMNLVGATKGEALLFGEPPDRASVRRRVGFVPENPAPYEYLTGREFVTLAGRLLGLSGQELSERVKSVLGAVEMGKAQDLQIRRYSKGMVQRIALAQALVGKPELLVLDEPTSGLDPLGRRQMRDLILAERERGTTVLFCTHIIPDVESLCERVAVLVGGKRVREGSVSELLSSETSSMDFVIENLGEEALHGLGFTFESIQAMEDRVLLRVADASSQPLLEAVMKAGGRVTRMQPARFTLEELFLSALQQAGRTTTVGGDIS